MAPVISRSCWLDDARRVDGPQRSWGRAPSSDCSTFTAGATSTARSATSLDAQVGAGSPRERRRAMSTAVCCARHWERADDASTWSRSRYRSTAASGSSKLFTRVRSDCSRTLCARPNHPGRSSIRMSKCAPYGAYVKTWTAECGIDATVLCGASRFTMDRYGSSSATSMSANESAWTLLARRERLARDGRKDDPNYLAFQMRSIALTGAMTLCFAAASSKS